MCLSPWTHTLEPLDLDPDGNYIEWFDDGCGWTMVLIGPVPAPVQGPYPQPERPIAP